MGIGEVPRYFCGALPVNKIRKIPTKIFQDFANKVLRDLSSVGIMSEPRVHPELYYEFYLRLLPMTAWGAWLEKWTEHRFFNQHDRPPRLGSIVLSLFLNHSFIYKLCCNTVWQSRKGGGRQSWKDSVPNSWLHDSSWKLFSEPGFKQKFHLKLP